MQAFSRGPAVESMHATVQPGYGSADILRFETVDRPKAGDDEVLVRVHAAGICKGDVHILTGKPWLLRLAYGLRRPGQRIPGQQMAGTVQKPSDGTSRVCASATRSTVR